MVATMRKRVSGFQRGGAKRGFSFLEIMLVVLIIGILVSIVGPNLLGRMERVRIESTRSQMDKIKTALVTYEMLAGDLPTTEQGLAALVTRPSDLDGMDWEQQMEAFPQDAWRQPFVYKCPGEGEKPYDLFSKGKDKREGTDDDVTVYGQSAETKT